MLKEEQARQIENLHYKLSRINRLVHPGQVIEMVLDILDIKYNLYNDPYKKKFHILNIKSICKEDAE